MAAQIIYLLNLSVASDLPFGIMSVSGSSGAWEPRVPFHGDQGQ